MKYPHIKLFNLCCGKYFLDIGKNQIYKINDSNYKDIQYLSKYGYEAYYKTHNNKKITAWLKNGYLSDKKPSIINHPYTYVVEDFLTTQTSNLLLQVTQTCNLRCAYCPYSGNGTLNRKHEIKKMSKDTALKSVDFLIKNSLYTDSLYIGFYGGEPLIEYDLIKSVVEYSKRLSQGKTIHYSITTNATLMSNELIDFLIENDFSVLVSLDGPEHIHDKNRRFVHSGSGSYKIVYKNLSFILKNYPNFVNNIGINAVWDLEENYDEVVDFFNNDEVLKNYKYSIMPVDSTIIDKQFSMSYKNYYEIDLKRLFDLIDYLIEDLSESNNYIDNRIETFDSIESALIPRVEMPFETHHAGVCFPGINRLFVDVDGNFWPCEKVSENSQVSTIGDINKGYNYEKIKELLNLGKLTEKECKECWCNPFCTSCIRCCDAFSTLSREKKLYECKIIQKTVMNNLTEYIIFQEVERNIKEAYNECRTNNRPLSN